VEEILLLLISLSIFCTSLLAIVLLLDGVAELFPGFGGLHPLPSNWEIYWERSVTISIIVFLIAAISFFIFFCLDLF
jgi:hypothetical protein